MTSDKTRKKQSFARKKYLDTKNNNLGYEYFKDSIGGYIVKVRARDYPTLKDLNPNRANKKNNSDFAYVRRSHKNWIDAGNELPPKGSVLYHLDGNPENDEVKNLCVVSRKILVTMCKKRRNTKFAEVNKSNLLLTGLEQKINASMTKEEKRKAASERSRDWYKKHKNDII